MGHTLVDVLVQCIDRLIAVQAITLPLHYYIHALQPGIKDDYMSISVIKSRSTREDEYVRMYVRIYVCIRCAPGAEVTVEL